MSAPYDNGGLAVTVVVLLTALMLGLGTGLLIGELL